MILVINVCLEKLHYYEFVKPVLDVLKGVEVRVCHYNDLKSEDLEECSKVIICGTSLRDSDYLENLDKFSWLEGFSKPVFGICAGFQILGLRLGGVLKKKGEIGFFHEGFGEDFLGFKGEVEVYHLHNNYVDFSGVDFSCGYQVLGNGIVQAFRVRNFYGVLFHPEVRNKEMILGFVGL